MQMMIGSRRSAPDGGSSSADAAALPAPTDPSVRLSVAGGEMVAVLRFSGYITPQTAEEARQRLVAALQQGVRCFVCVWGGGVILGVLGLCAGCVGWAGLSLGLGWVVGLGVGGVNI